MIKVVKKKENAKVNLKGTTVQILAEITVAMRAAADMMRKDGMDEEKIKDLLERASAIALKTDEEIREEAINAAERLLKKIEEMEQAR